MKSMIKFSMLFLIFAITIAIVLDVQSIALRKAELQDAVQTGMYNVLKATSINVMYPMDERDMSVELIREIAMNINTDSNLRIDIHQVDKRGLLSIEATTNFQHLNSEQGKRNILKTMVVDQYRKK